MNNKTAKWLNRSECREMARADGWVMVRFPRCAPFTMFSKEWDALPSADEGRKHQLAYDAALKGQQHDK